MKSALTAICAIVLIMFISFVVVGTESPNTGFATQNVKSCYDSDNGLFINEAGFVKVVNGRKTKVIDDTCQGYRVKEQYCQGTKAKSRTFECTQGAACLNGACVPLSDVLPDSFSEVDQEQKTFCFDSDGDDTTVYGLVAEKRGSKLWLKEDTCLKNNKVREWRCKNDQSRSKDIKCPANYECQDGACVSLLAEPGFVGTVAQQAPPPPQPLVDEPVVDEPVVEEPAPVEEEPVLPEPVDGGWSSWVDTTACSSFPAYKTQTRYCNNPVPQNGGLLCLGSNGVSRLEEESKSMFCMSYQTSTEVVNGGWSDWFDLNACGAVTPGMKTERRLCNNPVPQNGGLACLHSNGVSRVVSEDRDVACGTPPTTQTSTTSPTGCTGEGCCCGGDFPYTCSEGLECKQIGAYPNYYNVCAQPTNYYPTKKPSEPAYCQLNE